MGQNLSEAKVAVRWGSVSARCSVPSVLGSISLCLSHRNESDPREVQTQDQGNGTGEILVL